MKKSVGTLLILALLSACGGGGGSNAPEMAATPHAKFVGVNAIGSLGDTQFVGFQASTDTNGRVTLTSGGTNYDLGLGFAEVPTGILEVARVSGGNGPGALAQLTEGDQRLLNVDSETIAFGGSLDRSATVTFGLIGPALDGALKTSGSANWSGQSFAREINGSNVVVGTAKVTANFGNAGRVSADLKGNFGAIDSISISGMTVSDGQFGGGQMELRKNGAVVSPYGGSLTTQATGFFAGDVTNGTPAEAAGLFDIQGNTGGLTGGFIAN